MAEIEIIFDINPVPASRPRVTRWTTYYSEKYQTFKDTMEGMVMKLDKVFKEKGAPFEEPLFIGMIFLIEIPKSYSKKKIEQLDNQYCVSNMDIDNLEKAIYDALNGYAFKDDKQIVHHNVQKRWTKDKGKIIIKIQTI